MAMRICKEFSSMNKKDWIILIETAIIMHLLIYSFVFTIMSQDLIEQIRECDTIERKTYETVYENQKKLQ